MKKAALIILAIGLMSGIVLAAEFRFEVKGALHNSEDSNFKDIYGSAPKFGLAAGVGFAKNLSVWAGADYVHKTGSIAVINETTTVSLIPLSLGLRYEIPVGAKLRFHIGAGGQMVFFKEESSLGTASESGFGFLATGGGTFRVSPNVGIGLFVAWSTCSMKHADVEFKAGGLDFGGGIEFRF
jgi:hypothetical protein